MSTDMFPDAAIDYIVERHTVTRFINRLAADPVTTDGKRFERMRRQLVDVELDGAHALQPGAFDDVDAA